MKAINNEPAISEGNVSNTAAAASISTTSCNNVNAMIE